MIIIDIITTRPWVYHSWIQYFIDLFQQPQLRGNIESGLSTYRPILVILIKGASHYQPGHRSFPIITVTHYRPQTLKPTHKRCNKCFFSIVLIIFVTLQFMHPQRLSFFFSFCIGRPLLINCFSLIFHKRPNQNKTRILLTKSSFNKLPPINYIIMYQKQSGTFYKFCILLFELVWLWCRHPSLNLKWHWWNAWKITKQAIYHQHQKVPRKI